MFGIEYGKIIQNVFTVTKTGALLGLIVLALLIGWNAGAVTGNFGDFWTPHPSKSVIGATMEGLTAVSAFGLFIALCVTQTGSLFSSDAWNNITFTAGEVRNLRRNLPLALGLGTSLVIGLYLLANVAYLVVLPFPDIQSAAEGPRGDRDTGPHLPDRRRGAHGGGDHDFDVRLQQRPYSGRRRAYYAMVRDGLFFRKVGELNRARFLVGG